MSLHRLLNVFLGDFCFRPSQPGEAEPTTQYCIGNALLLKTSSVRRHWVSAQGDFGKTMVDLLERFVPHFMSIETGLSH